MLHEAAHREEFFVSPFYIYSNMGKLKCIFLAALASLSCIFVKAQTNLQVQYDFGEDRHQITSTIEGFYNDKWGNTFFFVDIDFKHRQQDGNLAPDGAYLELARCLNFWKDTKLSPLSVQVEYNGGRYRSFGINHAFLAGVDYFVHSKDFRNTFNFKVLYKKILYEDPSFESAIPMQFTFVWGMQNLFGVTGLRFCGFADFWWEDHKVAPFRDGQYIWDEARIARVTFLAEPQLWYQVGRHFGCENLNVGGEAELSIDFGSAKGYWLRPCVGLKWVF